MLEEHYTDFLNRAWKESVDQGASRSFGNRGEVNAGFVVDKVMKHTDSTYDVMCGIFSSKVYNSNLIGQCLDGNPHMKMRIILDGDTADHSSGGLQDRSALLKLMSYVQNKRIDVRILDVEKYNAPDIHVWVSDGKNVRFEEGKIDRRARVFFNDQVAGQSAQDCFNRFWGVATDVNIEVLQAFLMNGKTNMSRVLCA